jgi:hypothetical protein
MTLRTYFRGMKLIMFLSLVAWGLVIYSVDPEKAGIAGQVMFYASMFLTIAGIFILSLTWVRRRARDEETPFVYVGMSFRQGTLLAFLAVTLLVLQNFKVLTWWDGLLLVAAIFLMELYFLSR